MQMLMVRPNLFGIGYAFGVLFLSALSGGAVFFFSPKTFLDLFMCHVLAGVIAWFCLFFDVDRFRRRNSAWGFAIIFFASGMFFVPGHEFSGGYQFASPHIMEILKVVAICSMVYTGGYMAYASPMAIGEDLTN